jgi:hypothetical protein
LVAHTGLFVRGGGGIFKYCSPRYLGRNKKKEKRRLIQSLVLGTLLGISYSVFMKKWTLASSVAEKSTSLGKHICLAFFRIASIAGLFFGVSKIPSLDVFVVLFSFIAVITLFLFNLARNVYLPMIKAGRLHS